VGGSSKGGIERFNWTATEGPRPDVWGPDTVWIVRDINDGYQPHRDLQQPVLASSPFSQRTARPSDAEFSVGVVVVMVDAVCSSAAVQPEGVGAFQGGLGGRLDL
jgi:hypothetical protein